MLVAIFACLFSLLRWSFYGHGSRLSDEPCDSNSNDSIPTDDASISTPLCGGVHVFHNPENSTCDFVFFHGLHLVGNSKEAHVETWRGGDVVWPKEWLPQEYPRARVLTVSYDASLRMDNENGTMDLLLVAEKLMWDLLAARVGQSRPTVFIAHGFGGLVIKRICVEAQKHAELDHIRSLTDMLENLKGIFYYSTPHSGINEIERIASQLNSTGDKKGSLLELANELSNGAARLNTVFDRLPYRWKQAGVGENLPTKLGNGISPLLLVKEASSRAFSRFCVLDEDHFSICKHRTTTSSGYVHLLNFIETLNMHVSSSRPEDWQILPPKLVGCLANSTALEEFVKKFHNGKVIGICGMGGLGKTTAAKALFNHLHRHFEFTLFAENVKLVLGRCNDDRDEFERKIFAKFHHQGKNLLESESRSLLSSVTGKKILVVLDDVEQKQDDIKHIETQLSIITKLRDFCDSDKSRFLVTSRDKHVFRGMDHQLIDFEFLDERNSNCLLAAHAIKDDEPEKDREWKKNSVGKISKHCGCLPLSLEVLGKYLMGKPEDVWKETMKALREKDDKRPGVENVRKVLRISYDGLKPEEKEMFKDACTLFQRRVPVGYAIQTLGDAKAVWAVKYKNRSNGYWQTLVDRALVYHVPEGSPIQLHEHLQDLGESLSKQEGELLEIETKIRKPIIDIQGLKTPETWQKIRFLSVSYPSSVPERKWLGLSNLEYLWLHNCGVEGERVYLPRTLLTLCVEGSLHNLCLDQCERLVFLDLTDNNYSEPSALSFPHFPNLMRFHLSSTIRSLPEKGMAGMRALRELEIRCRELEKLPESFGSLCQLQILKLNECKKLETLPESFDSLASLHTLSIVDCFNLVALPKSFGSLRELQNLDIHGCFRLQKLPESFSSLSVLRTLLLQGGPQLGTLPESFGSLSRLQSLRISGHHTLPASMQKLPDTFVQLRSLQRLSLQECPSLVKLPDSFGSLEQLRDLELEGCNSLKALPDTWGRLQKLSLRRCGMLATIPDSLGALQSLTIKNCSRIQALLDTIDHLPRLKELSLQDCHGLRALPDTLGHLPCLETLEIRDCDMLETLPNSLGNLKALRVLTVIDCEGVQALPDSIDGLQQLRTLILRGSHRLQALPDALGRLPCLETLEIRDCDMLETLPNSLGNLKALRVLTVIDCKGVQALPDSIDGLQQLRTLILRGSHRLQALPDALGRLPCLETLEIIDCDMLETLPDSVGSLEQLRALELRKCDGLQALPDTLGSLPCLEKLDIAKCAMLDTLPESLGSLKPLQDLNIRDSVRIQNIGGRGVEVRFWGSNAPEFKFESELCPDMFMSCFKLTLELVLLKSFKLNGRWSN